MIPHRCRLAHQCVLHTSVCMCRQSKTRPSAGQPGATTLRDLVDTSSRYVVGFLWWLLNTCVDHLSVFLHHHRWFPWNFTTTWFSLHVATSNTYPTHILSTLYSLSTLYILSTLYVLYTGWSGSATHFHTCQCPHCTLWFSRACHSQAQQGTGSRFLQGGDLCIRYVCVVCLVCCVPCVYVCA